jgi:uncharacterized damage-inducible protein DinB
MQKQQIAQMYGYLNMVHHTTLNVINAFPEDKLDWLPKPNMRSARELIEHIYAQGVAKAKAVSTGKMSLEDLLAENTAPKSGDAQQLAKWADDRFAETQKFVAAVTQEQCDAPVEAFFGTMPGGVILSITYDEWWHHRGQLTIYLRLLEIEVPDIYAYPQPGS